VRAEGRASAAPFLLAAVEGLTRRTLDQLRQLSGGSLRLAVTQHRARFMGLTTDLTRSMSVGLNGQTDPDQIVRMSSARGSVAREAHDLREASAPEMGGLTLARLGRLIPAVVGVPADTDRSLELRRLIESRAVLTATTEQIEAMAADMRLELTYVSDGPVPLEEAENARFMMFREGNGLLEHVAVVIGDRESWPDPVPVRLHSACLTGDLFGSLRCDCGDQLRGSLRVFAAKGGGVLLYLAQEGRGIGLGNKLRAYVLQQGGLDTVDADGTLGFGADERRYDAAIAMLRHLQIERILLLTNNPEKVRALEAGGIQVKGRQPLFGTINTHNLRYVTAKVQRAGHWLEEMLSGALPAK
jgi:GTP cyclohydrolase II